ncbi:MAG: hypothetical protein O2857_18590 [Planctomycetota bacterium]|nr:hypothetical protein [Planctomycetota bacterium]
MAEECVAGKEDRVSADGPGNHRNSSPSLHHSITQSLLSGLCLLLLTSAHSEVEFLKTDSRSRFVHRITLYDEGGTAISPSDQKAPPYSPSHTCGKCHPYGLIHKGWHFNAADKDVNHGRPGEPWILVDEPTGTQIPLSYRGWKNTFRPEDVGLTYWKFIQEFGRHMPGSGVGERRDKDKEDLLARWMIAGNLEVDCLLCHSADQRHDPVEWGVQIAKQNFKWAPTAATDFAMVRGEAKLLPEDYDPFAGPNPDFPDQKPPQVIYDKTKFDANDRFFFNVTKSPPNDRCYFCHTAISTGHEETHWQTDTDVHIAAGLKCVDCHRNGLDHAINRGIEGDPATPAALSCQGCHLGESEAREGLGLGGRFAAPRPEHKGLPTLHLEKMSCTSCHAGPWPGHIAGGFKTSMAHQLGIAPRYRQALPLIAGTAFLRDESEKITPHRMIWPAYFGTLDGDVLKPIAVEDVRDAGQGIVKEKKSMKEEATLPDQKQISQIISKLQKSVEKGEVVYVTAGKVHRAGNETLVSSDHSAAAPYTWAFAHDVRPGAQSLGVNGCTDCHAAGKPIYFGKVTALSPVAGLEGESAQMFELRNEDPQLVEAWTKSFKGRSTFFYFAVVGVFIIASLTLLYFFKGLAALAQKLGQ